LPIAPTRFVTAVSLDDQKKGPLLDLLESVQATLTRRLPGSFRPYSLEQIHGTLIILSGRADDQVPGAVIGQYYLEHRGERRVIDFERALQILQARLAQPIRIRVGGFGPSDPGPFTSQGRPLAERSFSARGDALVLMGWPVSSLAGGGRAQPLDALRREMAEAGVLHKYHVRSADVDNDFHLVVGHYADAPAALVAAAVGAVREDLAGRSVEFDVGLDQVRILATDSTDLAAPWFSSGLPVAADRIAGLYS
jgi:hypothetical protein